VEPSDFTFRDGERVVRFGRGAAAQAVDLIRSAGIERYALLSTARALDTAPTGLLNGARSVVVIPDGQVPQLAAAVAAEAGEGPFVALGGGRVIDTAKALAATAGSRCVAIPTTLAGSPLTPFHRLPEGVRGAAMVRPALAVCDPGLMASVPMPGLAATAMNALAHAVESLYAPGANPIAGDAAVRAIAGFGRAFVADPPDPDQLALAAVLAGWAVGTTGLALHHALCQTIVGETGASHARTNALVLPHTFAFMASRAPREIGLAADALEADGTSAAQQLSDLAVRAGATSLSGIGVGEVEVGRLLGAAEGHRALGATPGGAVTRAELRELLTKIL